jgi:hypothetical protein
MFVVLSPSHWSAAGGFTTASRAACSVALATYAVVPFYGQRIKAYGATGEPAGLRSPTGR